MIPAGPGALSYFGGQFIHPILHIRRALSLYISGLMSRQFNNAHCLEKIAHAVRRARGPASAHCAGITIRVGNFLPVGDDFRGSPERLTKRYEKRFRRRQPIRALSAESMFPSALSRNKQQANAAATSQVWRLEQPSDHQRLMRSHNALRLFSSIRLRASRPLRAPFMVFYNPPISFLDHHRNSVTRQNRRCRASPAQHSALPLRHLCGVLQCRFPSI